MEIAVLRKGAIRPGCGIGPPRIDLALTRTYIVMRVFYITTHIAMRIFANNVATTLYVVSPAAYSPAASLRRCFSSA
jgi:hypothetical protein